MVGLLIVTHSDLAGELLRAAEMIIGPASGTRSIAIYRENSVDDVSREITQAFSEVDQGDGVVIMTDMFGGTPTNLSLALMEKDGVEIIAGVNLPMVIKFFNSRQEGDVNKLANILRDYAADKVMLVSEVLAGQGAAGR